jgi:CRISPR-associated protein Cst1
MANVNISFKPTGDPFVDASGDALKYVIDLNPHKTIPELIDNMAKIFVYKWDNKIDSVQLNGLITHNTRRGTPDRKQKAIEAVNEFYKNPKYEEKTGYCRICGSLGKLRTAGREQLCLTGGVPFVNFHHSHEEGLLICYECSVKLFFLPLIVFQMGNMLALLQTENPKSKKYWIDWTVKENMNKSGKGISDGILKSEYGNPKNALIKIASDIITEVNDDAFSDYLQLYHFTNFGASPNCEIYRLPNPVFSFLNKVIKYCHSDWYVFVQRHYHIKKSSWDYDGDHWISGKDNQPMSEEDYLNNPNDIFERLLNSDSILGQLRKFYKDAYIHNKRHSKITMAIYYTKEVLGMRQEQIDLIKKVANVVFDLAQKENNYKKYVVMLEGAGKAYQLRSVLLKIIKENYKNGASEPVIRLQDYVDYLFPDGQFWGEVRDLMLIYLYERLHDENINRQEVIADMDIAETTEEINEEA